MRRPPLVEPKLWTRTMLALGRRALRSDFACGALIQHQ